MTGKKATKKKRKKQKKRRKLWIQEAIEKPGALIATVKRRFGRKGFTERGTIKVELLHKLAKKKGVTGFRARLALKLREFGKKKKGRKRKVARKRKRKRRSRRRRRSR